MKRVRPIFISHHAYRSSTARLRSKNNKADSMVDVATHSQASERQILVALGFITALLLFGGVQLYRCVNNSGKIKAIAPQRSLTLDLTNSPSIAPSVKLKSLTDVQKTETLTIQNSISQGKF